MYFLFAIVIILVGITYAMDPEKKAAKLRRKQRAKDPFHGRFGNQSTTNRGHHTIDKGQLVRCHQCACFFSPVKLVNAVVEGHVLEFCSENCRNHFLS